MEQIAAHDRPRERLDRLGPSGLTDAELVAILLGSGSRRASALEVAQELLADHGGLAGLAKARAHEISGTHSMGPAKTSVLRAAFELGQRVGAGATPRLPVIRGPGDVAAVARTYLTDPHREECVVLVLNSGSRLLRAERTTVGTESRCLMEAKDVLQLVLSHGGTSFAVVHTHPAGGTSPSASDLAATEDLQRASEVVGVRFLDHVILAGSKWQSLREHLERQRGD